MTAAEKDSPLKDSAEYLAGYIVGHTAGYIAGRSTGYSAGMERGFKLINDIKLDDEKYPNLKKKKAKKKTP